MIGKSRGFTLIELMIAVTGVLSVLTGAIGVKWSPKNTGRRPTPAKLEIWRPLYKSLVEQRATITINDIKIENQRQASVD